MTVCNLYYYKNCPSLQLTMLKEMTREPIYSGLRTAIFNSIKRQSACNNRRRPSHSLLMNERTEEGVRSLAILLYNNLTCQRRWTSGGGGGDEIMEYGLCEPVWPVAGCGHVPTAGRRGSGNVRSTLVRYSVDKSAEKSTSLGVYVEWPIATPLILCL